MVNNEERLTVATPIGDLTLVARGENLLAAYLEVASKRYTKKTKNPILLKAAKQLAEYFSGKRKSFSLPLAPNGTDFQKQVWSALESIPYGGTCFYGEIAVSINHARAARAVGLACSKNPLILFIPCHRVVASNGLGGYSAAGGTKTKQKLLSLEANK